jgi:hypothetical protein
MAKATSGGLAQRLREDGDVGGMSVGMSLPPRIGDAGVDAAAVVVADVPADVPVVLESLDEAGERALAQMDLLGELLDPAMSLRSVGETAKDLVFGEGEAMLSLETVFECLADPSVLGLELIPPI